MNDFLDLNIAPGDDAPKASSPRNARWQLLRSGLLNLYKYDEQVFCFEEGRLLLRGNNGTGKSRVLALQLPFLLDGEVSPSRVEPDQDPHKRFEWNLLMGRHEDRLGYTWIEFGRRDETGDQYLTLGCGLRAVSGRGLVKRWLFMTPQRIGIDLDLRRPEGSALTRDDLAEVLSPGGRIFETATEYRSAVNQALFKLEPERYEALLDLLIELRHPQLSRQLDEKRLSEALGNALPPIPPRIIATVAEAMRGLEEERHALEDLQAAHESAEKFLAEYRRYAQILARRRADLVRTTQGAYEGKRRHLSEAESQRDQATAEREMLRQRMEDLGRQIAGGQGERQTLESSPEMRSARDLEAAVRRAIERQAEAERAVREHADAAESAGEAHAAMEQRTASCEESATRARELLAEATQAAEPPELMRDHARYLPQSGMPAIEEPQLLRQAEQRLEQCVQRRRQGARVLRQLNADVETAKQAWTGEVDRRDGEAERLAESAEAMELAERSASEAAGQLVEEYRAWQGALLILLAEPAEQVVPALREWCEEPQGPSPLESAVRAAVAQLKQDVTLRRAELRQQRRGVEVQLAELRAEYDALAQGRHEPPAAPHTRDIDRRAQREGAPLWLLCEFREDVNDADRAGLEAALESAGLLDAWVNPDGSIVVDDCDTFLLADIEADPAMHRSLAAALRPAEDRPDVRSAAVSPQLVQRILERVGLGVGDGSAWVDVRGAWRIGPKQGRWQKPASQHIGQAAREAHRQRRMSELEGRLAEVRAMIGQIDEELSAVDDREQAGLAEAGRAPEDSAVRQALANVEAALAQRDRAQQRLAEAEQRVIHRRETLDVAAHERDRQAADLGLARWVGDLQGLEDALADYGRALGRVWPALREWGAALRQQRDVQRSLEQARQREERSRQHAADASEKAASAQAERDTLQRMVGAAVQEVQRQLQAVLDQLRELDVARLEAHGGHAAAGERIRASEQAIETLNQAVQEEVVRRAEAIEHLLRLANSGLLDIASADLAGQGRGELSVTSAVDLARTVEALLREVDMSQGAWDRNQRSISGHVEDLFNALRSRDYRPERTIEDDGVLVVTVPFRGQNRSMAEFRAMLGEEILNHQGLLSAKERELMERYLIDDVATELAGLIRRAEELVRDMNQQLRSRPTSTGMALQFKWEPLEDGPAAFAEARRKLLGASGAWSARDRSALGAFLQEQINRVRQANDTGTWQEHLVEALDYRRWHQFYVEQRRENKWMRLTRRTHGTGSGGEKALALTVPQFAAAAAYYGSADRLSPRLILLDEAFVGIDADMRSKCMGLLSEFDLDFVMTSEREWGCYPTMPGLAIYQLAARAGIDAVWASRWVWNGRERRRDDGDGQP